MSLDALARPLSLLSGLASSITVLQELVQAINRVIKEIDNSGLYEDVR